MKKIIIAITVFAALLSCGFNEPTPIKLNVDSCDFCKMTISNSKYACELITENGRCYKFDDVSCMIRYAKSNTSVAYKGFYVNDYLMDNKLIPAEKGFYLIGGTISAPMGGKVAAFSKNEDAKSYQIKLKAKPVTWKEIYNTYQ